MLKYAVAVAVLFASLAASGSAAVGAPRNDDCVNCETPKAYDSENPARIRQEMDRRRAPDVPAQSETPAAPVRDTYTKECANCPPPRHYDNVEVVKTSRDVDQSRVLNTESVVHVPPRIKEVNKLVIHENETRNVGVIQHNHRIIEKEIRYVKRAPVYRRQAPAYRVQTVLVPVVVQQPSLPCGCPCTCSGHGYAQQYVYGGDGYAYSSGRGGLLQHLQQAQQVQQVQVQQVLVPYGYGYR